MLIKKITKSSYTMMLAGVIISTLTLIAVSFICSVVASLNANPSALIGTMTLVSIILSAAVGGSIITRICGEEGVKITTLTALLVSLIMMLIGLISNHGALPTSGIMNYICYLLTSVFFGVVARRRAGAKKHRRHTR